MPKYNFTFRGVTRISSLFLMAVMIATADVPSLSNEKRMDMDSIRALDADTLVVFVCAGQSNMVGSRSEWSEVPVADREALQEGLNGVYHFDGSEWLPYRIPELRFGPELAFAASMRRELDRPIGIIHHARGGSNLAEDWNPEVADSLYQGLKEKVLNAQSAAKIKIVGMIWMQGENDSRDEAMSAAYGENLKNFIQRARADFKSPYMIFIAGRVNPRYPDGNWRQRFAFTPVVREAQENLQIERYGWIDCDDIPKVADNLHYDTNGLIKLGRRFAAKMVVFLANN